MSKETQIVLKNDGWEIKVIDVRQYVAGEGKEVATFTKLSLSSIISLLQEQSYATTDLMVIDAGDLRKLVEQILINTVKTLNTTDGIRVNAA